MLNKSKAFYERELERLFSHSAKEIKQRALLRQSRAYMESNFEDNIDSSALAKAALMSRFHYVRMFKQLYGVTPRHYLRDLRISKAKVFLKEGKSITDTCFEVGYESVTTFSSVFKKCTGLSPRDFQARHKSNLE
ncbi:helix-turn-helix domain-containing protein [Vibrio astriarenae]|uniref:helix-turn-helix domain-containing protein n=1 Tax=Vibrio astriarenae TaxID=1481923 RepID=UPI003736152A